jgi:hypothetical protein
VNFHLPGAIGIDIPVPEQDTPSHPWSAQPDVMNSLEFDIFGGFGRISTGLTLTLMSSQEPPCVIESTLTTVCMSAEASSPPPHPARPPTAMAAAVRAKRRALRLVVRSMRIPLGIL